MSTADKGGGGLFSGGYGTLIILCTYTAVNKGWINKILPSQPFHFPLLLSPMHYLELPKIKINNST